MSEPKDEKGPIAEQHWVRSARGFPAKNGPWHLVRKRADRSWGRSLTCECGTHPDLRHQSTHGERPTEGKFCRKCERAAEGRVSPPGSTTPAETGGGQ